MRNWKLLKGEVKRFKKPPFPVELFLKLKALLMVLLYAIPRGLGEILVFKKVKAATGGALKASISGGGALPYHIDEFFAAIGLKILEGYGLTETSPVISVRLPHRVVLGTVGPPIQGTEIKIIDENTGEDVTHQHGRKGTLYVRGPQVMKGYYKNPKKTQEVLSPDGWFNTGDLVTLTINNELSIVGRSKDTIVLRGGENVEPTPLEELLKSSPYIDHCMLVGQDQKTLGVLIVPNQEELSVYVKEKNIPGESLKEWIEHPEVIKLYEQEVDRIINQNPQIKPFEKIPVQNIRLLSKPFEKGQELNNTLKLRRNIVAEMYKDLIDSIYKS